jgi:hypothetical protein
MLRRQMLRVVSMTILGVFCLAGAAPAPLLAQDRSEHRRGKALPVTGPLEGVDRVDAAKGCYWYRQKQYCGRYCYIEANGIRYCREREPEAFPQMPEADVFVGAPYTAGASSGVK